MNYIKIRLIEKHVETLLHAFECPSTDLELSPEGMVEAV
jgi:hypothetical protein